MKLYHIFFLCFKWRLPYVVFLFTWNGIYHSSILVRIYTLIVHEDCRESLVRRPWGKEDCWSNHHGVQPALPNWSLILDRSYSPQDQDIQPKQRRIWTSSSVEFRWSDWKCCQRPQSHVSEAIYHRTKLFASSNCFLCCFSFLRRKPLFPVFTFLPLLALTASVTGHSEMLSLMCFL